MLTDTASIGTAEIGTPIYNGTECEPLTETAIAKKETLTHLIYEFPFPGLGNDDFNIHFQDDYIIIDTKKPYEPVYDICTRIWADWMKYDRHTIEAIAKNGILSIAIAKIIPDTQIIVK